MKKGISILLIATIVAFGFTQLFPTSIKITVINELGNYEEGVEVQLYASEEDYKNEENPVTGKELTDKKGVVKFKDLKPKEYWVLAEKGDKNNWGAGVKTNVLEEGKVNKVNIVIE